MTIPSKKLAVHLLDLPPIMGDDKPRPWIAVGAEWFGGAAVWRSLTGAGFDLWASVTRPSTMGALVTALPAGAGDVWDSAAGFDIALDHGELYGTSTPEADAGANLLAVQAAPGTAWELLSFAGAELIGPKRYRITGLRRGRHDTAPAEIPAGAAAVLMDGGPVQLPLPPRHIGFPHILRISPANKPYADPLAVEIRATFNPPGYRWPALVVQPVALTIGAQTAPVSPRSGDVHIVGGAPVGAWSGHPHHVAGWLFDAWRFQAPFNGYIVSRADTCGILQWGKGAWK